MAAKYITGGIGFRYLHSIDADAAPVPSFVRFGPDRQCEVLVGGDARRGLINPD